LAENPEEKDRPLFVYEHGLAVVWDDGPKVYRWDEVSQLRFGIDRHEMPDEAHSSMVTQDELVNLWTFRDGHTLDFRIFDAAVRTLATDYWRFGPQRAPQPCKELMRYVREQVRPHRVAHIADAIDRGLEVSLGAVVLRRAGLRVSEDLASPNRKQRGLYVGRRTLFASGCGDGSVHDVYGWDELKYVGFHWVKEKNVVRECIEIQPKDRAFLLWIPAFEVANCDALVGLVDGHWRHSTGYRGE
jgi:hypothetical protein